MILWNKYTLIGIGLIIIGIPLSLVWIGVPIMIIGFLIADFGIVYRIVKKVPKLEGKFNNFFRMIKNSYNPYFGKKVIKK